VYRYAARGTEKSLARSDIELELASGAIASEPAR
jgi:hypothetical protein